MRKWAFAINVSVEKHLLNLHKPLVFGVGRAKRRGFCTDNDSTSSLLREAYVRLAGLPASAEVTDIASREF